MSPAPYRRAAGLLSALGAVVLALTLLLKPTEAVQLRLTPGGSFKLHAQIGLDLQAARGPWMLNAAQVSNLLSAAEFVMPPDSTVIDADIGVLSTSRGAVLHVDGPSDNVTVNLAWKEGDSITRPRPADSRASNRWGGRLRERVGKDGRNIHVARTGLRGDGAEHARLERQQHLLG
jgi:hypothetical protein